MRIAHVADLHLTETPSRSDVPLDEQDEILCRIAEAVNEAEVDRTLISGDCFDGESTPLSRLVLSRFLHRVAPAVVIYGNHDRPVDLDLFESHGVTIHHAPEVFAGAIGGYDLAVAPWPRVRNAEGYAAIVKGLRAQCGEKAILLAHCDLVGAELDGGQDTTGRVDAVISADDLAEMGWAYCALGHYHKRQLHPWGGYAGGIRPMKFGDDARKGVVIVDLDTGKREEIDCAGYSLVTVDLDITRDIPLVHGQTFALKDRVRIRYRVDEENQTAAYGKAESVATFLRNHVRSVTIEPEVIPTVRVRAPEIAAAKTDEDVLRAYLRQAGVKRVEEVCKKAELE